MEKIKLITDSTCDISPELIEKYQVHVLPLTVHIGDASYKDGETITLEKLYEGVDGGGPFPSTSQVNPNEFHEVYQKYLKEGYKIISIHISGQLSGTVQSAEIAKDMTESDQITVIDSKGVSGSALLPLIVAGEMIENGHTYDEVVKSIRENAEKVKVLAAFDTLTYLVKGGRVPKSVGAIGSLLGIKPLISVKDGKLEMTDKVRGSKKALKALMKSIDETKRQKNSKILVINSLDSSVNQSVISYLKQKNIPHISVQVGCVLGVHAGPKMVGLFTLTP